VKWTKKDCGATLSGTALTSPNRQPSSKSYIPVWNCSGYTVSMVCNKRDNPGVAGSGSLQVSSVMAGSLSVSSAISAVRGSKGRVAM
jgi:hypothetical protein